MHPAYNLAPYTILVVNSSVPQSLTDALDYCSKRGIPVANIRAFNFGTTDYSATYATSINMPGASNSSTTFYRLLSVNVSCQNGNSSLYGPSGSNPQPFYNASLTGALLPTLASDITTNGALAIICSTYTPSTMYSTDGSYAHSFSALCASAAVLTGQSTYSPPGPPNSSSVAASLAALADTAIPTNWATLTQLRPHGRLGCPDFSGGAFGELAPRSGIGTVYSNAVAGAIACEATNNFAKPTFICSTVNDTYFSGTSISAAHWAFMQGVPGLNLIDGGNDAGSTSLYYNMKWTPYPVTQPLPSVWAMCTGKQANDQVTAVDATKPANFRTSQYLAYNMNVQKGAFGGTWYSFSFNLGQALLWNGASAAVMTVAEPLAYYISYPHHVQTALIKQGVPLALANFWSPTWSNTGAVMGTSVFGDPLYAPYKAYNLTNLSVTTDYNS
jgi:hypothetical protein